jgi:SPP1 family predicted phage head-tail adaptor
MNAGRLNKRVTIRTNIRTPDGMGGYSETPTDVPDIPASIDPLEGSEQLRAMETGMQRPHRIVMRYREGMTGAKTLIYSTRTFDIKSVVDPQERHRELHLLADEVNA